MSMEINRDGKLEDRQTALNKWTDHMVKLVQRNLPTFVRGERRIHVSLKQYEDLISVLTRFEIYKQRIIVEHIINKLDRHTAQCKSLENSYKNTAFIMFKKRRRLFRKFIAEQNQMKATQETLLIVVNTLPQ